MEDRSLLLITTPFDVTNTATATTMQTKSTGNMTTSKKRRHYSDHVVVRSCFSRRGSVSNSNSNSDSDSDSSSSIAMMTTMHNNKKQKLRRCCISWDIRPSSKVTTATAAKNSKEKKKGDINSCSTKSNSNSKSNPNETWYSKAEYKKILLEQCLTVHIMRSLRTIAAKTKSKTKTSSTTDDDDDDNNDDDDDDSNGNGNGNGSPYDELIKKNLIDPEEYCERGLESYQSEEGRSEINSNRKLHKFLVIGEHVRQGVVGTKDPELVRSISMTQSKKSSIKAQLLAAIDQREVQANNNDSSKKNENDSNSDNDNDNENERKQELSLPQLQLHPPQEQHINAADVRRGATTTTPLDSLWSRGHHHQDNNKSAVPSHTPSGLNERRDLLHGYAQGVRSMDMDMDMDMSFCNPLQPIHRNDTRVVSQAIRDPFFKQQQIQQYHRDLLVKQQQQHALSQSQYHPQHNNSNNNNHNHKINMPNGSSATAASIMSNSMLAAYQMEQQLFHAQNQQQQQFQQYVQRLLVLQQHQHQQHCQSLALATAALVGQQPPPPQPT